MGITDFFSPNAHQETIFNLVLKPNVIAKGLLGTRRINSPKNEKTTPYVAAKIAIKYFGQAGFYGSAPCHICNIVIEMKNDRKEHDLRHYYKSFQLKRL